MRRGARLERSRQGAGGGRQDEVRGGVLPPTASRRPPTVLRVELDRADDFVEVVVHRDGSVREGGPLHAPAAENLVEHLLQFDARYCSLIFAYCC